MAALPCPHCNLDTLSWWQKYRLAKWLIWACPNCHGRVCSNPFVLAVYTMLYVWDVLLFGALAYFDKNPWYILVGIIGWIILDGFSLYLPVSALQGKFSSDK